MRYHAITRTLIFTIIFTVSGIKVSAAAESDNILREILKKINDIHKQMVVSVTNWTDTKDPNDIIANNQNLFAKLNQAYSNNLGQITLSNQLTSKFLINGSGETPKIAPTNAYELTYGAVSQPSNNPQAVNALTNYISYAAGTNLPIRQAESTWKSGHVSQQYKALYNTLAAITSYNSYILGDLNMPPEQTKIRQQLLKQASNSDWFAYVSSESLGLVLRQLLMYTSQVYVQLDRILKIQQQQLTLQAMNNTLLIGATNFTAMDGLYDKAMHEK